MKRNAWRLLPLLGLFVAAGAWAASEQVAFDETHVVAPAEAQAYMAGMKAFAKCLHEHDFKYRVTGVAHITGKEYRYSYVSDFGSWGDLDKIHEASMVCNSVWMSQIDPHVKSGYQSFDVLMPDMSNIADPNPPDSGFIFVIEDWLKPGHKARDTYVKNVEMIIAAMRKTKWGGHAETLAINGGGSGAPDFVIVIPFKNFAEWGKPIEPPLWKMVANVYGQKKAEEIRDALDSVLKHSSSHYDAIDPDLSYTPSH